MFGKRLVFHTHDLLMSVLQFWYWRELSSTLMSLNPLITVPLLYVYFSFHTGKLNGEGFPKTERDGC